MDMVDISYTFPKMNDELFCKILIFSRFVSRLASYQTNFSLSRLQRRGDILKARVSHIHL